MLTTSTLCGAAAASFFFLEDFFPPALFTPPALLDADFLAAARFLLFPDFSIHLVSLVPLLATIFSLLCLDEDSIPALINFNSRRAHHDERFTAHSQAD
jgi:hypothetical protein